ncbi:DUF6385 domain-containing protein [Paenibacillus radicis (ex Xue et al. 2023)]|uniref:DUF6385 domain-containing protein n=1 Tax=Paenibacillus radicis (ex Xue et al. 2023) TaxID=2972489 RepID=A0ABT1YPC6_9BACL|nr:DUF6385 domain-containing protein [Paenibacillus radicis (ex Xue et al. 2023)]MCR8635027.1 DUF6385 domain-containing protein [Paenibacillus radicis (ex Xue et al. 2023)]
MPALKYTACRKTLTSCCCHRKKKYSHRCMSQKKLFPKKKTYRKHKYIIIKKCCKPIRPIIKKLRVNVQRTRFIEQERLGVTTENEWKPSLLVNSSLLKLYTYSIVNRGNHASEVKVEISPNGLDFMQDSKMVVAAGTTQAIVPMRYLKFTRFSVKSQQLDQPTMLDIYFQAQTQG